MLCSHQSNTTSVFCRSLLISFCSGVTSGKYSMTKLMIDACIADSSTPDCNIPVPTFTEDFVIWGASFSRGQMWLPWRLVLLVQYNYVYCICIGGISFHYLRQTIFFFFQLGSFGMYGSGIPNPSCRPPKVRKELLVSIFWKPINNVKTLKTIFLKTKNTTPSCVLQWPIIQHNNHCCSLYTRAPPQVLFYLCIDF